MVKDLRQFLGQLFTDLQKLLEVLAPLVAKHNKPMCRKANAMHTGVTITPFGMATMNENLTSGVVRGVAGVATATPIFQILFYKIVPKISQKFFYLL